MEPIIESDMQFGPYSDDEVFWIEKSRLYTRRLEPNGVKCCEFILNRGKNIFHRSKEILSQSAHSRKHRGEEGQVQRVY